MLHVLVVEDSASMRGYIRAILEDAGGSDALGVCAVTLAPSGFEAMRQLPRRAFDLMITDINMTDINGLELIRFVRTSQHLMATPVVVISTQSSSQDVARAMALGADGFLAKPFNAEALRAACLCARAARGGG